MPGFDIDTPRSKKDVKDPELRQAVRREVRKHYLAELKECKEVIAHPGFKLEVVIDFGQFFVGLPDGERIYGNTLVGDSIL